MHFFFSVFQQATQIDYISSGNFVNFKEEQILLSRGDSIDLLGSKKNGKLVLIFSANYFQKKISINSFHFNPNKKKLFFNLRYKWKFKFGLF